MIAVILAGGFGTRLRSVVSDLPKPLAPVGGKYFLEYLVEQLKENGIHEFIFCLHYMADKIVDHFGNGEKHGIKIAYSIEEQPLGTAGAIGLCRNKLNSTFCVLNADTYLNLDIEECVQRHRTQGAMLSMAVAYMQDTGRYGRVQLRSDGNVEGFLEKGQMPDPSGYINAGFYIFEPRIFEYIPYGIAVSMERDVFPVLLQSGEKVISYSGVEHFFDIGIPEDYSQFQQWMAETITE